MSTQVATKTTIADREAFIKATIEQRADFLRETFGNGKYFQIQSECFKDTIRIFPEDEISFEAAIKIAKAVATWAGVEFGKGQASFKGLEKKSDKDGNLKTLSEITKLKGVKITNEVAFVRLLNYVNGARQYHCTVRVETMDEMLSEWVESMN